MVISRDPEWAPLAYLQASDGIFRNMMFHGFNMACSAPGEEVMGVFATGSRLVASEMMEQLENHGRVDVILTMATGSQCFITNSSRAAYGYDQLVEAFGSKGMAQSENNRSNHMVLSTGGQTGRGAPLLNPFIERDRDALIAEIDAFDDAMEEETTPEVRFEGGRCALILADAAVKSAVEGRGIQVNEIG